MNYLCSGCILDTKTAWTTSIWIFFNMPPSRRQKATRRVNPYPLDGGLAIRAKRHPGEDAPPSSLKKSNLKHNLHSSASDTLTFLSSSAKPKRKPWKHYGENPITNMANVPKGWSDEEPDLEPELVSTAMNPLLCRGANRYRIPVTLKLKLRGVTIGSKRRSCRNYSNGDSRIWNKESERRSEPISKQKNHMGLC